MTFVYFHKYRRDEPTSCPVCWLGGGFHETSIHAAHQVPRELIKETGWHKQKD